MKFFLAIVLALVSGCAAALEATEAVLRSEAAHATGPRADQLRAALALIELLRAAQRAAAEAHAAAAQETERARAAAAYVETCTHRIESASDDDLAAAHALARDASELSRVANERALHAQEQSAAARVQVADLEQRVASALRSTQ